MYKAYQYLFYKLHTWFLKKDGKDDVPEYTALFGVSLLILINLFSLLIISNVFLDFFHFPKLSRGKFALGFIPYILVNYFLLIFNGKVKKIIKKYKKQGEKEKRRGNKKVWSYIIITFLLLILSLGLMVMKNEGIIL